MGQPSAEDPDEGSADARQFERVVRRWLWTDPGITR